MQTTINDRNGCLDENGHLAARRRLHFALSRFAPRIDHVTLTVEDQNGPRGGIDKACRLRIGLRNLNEVVVQDQDAEVGVCIGRVAQRAARTVRRTIERAQRFPRHSAASLAPFEST